MMALEGTRALIWFNFFFLDAFQTFVFKKVSGDSRRVLMRRMASDGVASSHWAGLFP